MLAPHGARDPGRQPDFVLFRIKQICARDVSDEQSMKVVQDFCAVLSTAARRLRSRSEYTRALEEEVARLRAENRALVNSILGLAGIPPMSVLEAGDLRLDAGKVKLDGTSGSTMLHRHFATRVQGDADEEKSATPLRRRSWRQIGRAREVEDARAARRERESDTDAFPEPRNIVPRV